MVMKETDIGRRVMYHGPSEGALCYSDHFRVKAIHNGIVDHDNGHRTIGKWCDIDDRCGFVFRIPQSLLSPVLEDCWCDACDNS